MPTDRPAAVAAPVRLTALTFLVLGLVQAIWPLTMDLYLPAFPTIVADLDTSASAIQATLTAAFVGMALGQLLTGPWSDRVGRFRPMLVALAVYLAASVACAVAPTAGVLIGARFAQGLGAASAAVLTIAMVRDATEGPRMVRALAHLQLVNGTFVVLAPSLGAWLLAVMPWRGMFWILAGVGVGLLALTAWALSPRRLRGAAAAAPGPADRPRLYAPLLADRRYLLAVAGGALVFAAMMSYMASSAFLFLEHFGLSEATYAVIFGGHGLFMIAGAQVSARVAGRVAPVRVVVIGASALLGAAAVATALGPFAGDGRVWLFIVPLFVFTTAFGFVNPALQEVALHDHRDRAGSAASLMGATRMVAGSAAAPLVGAVGAATPTVVGGAMLVCCALAAVVLIALGRTARATGTGAAAASAAS
ncbi:Bcr/CflA family efflux MFS transporter [Demequina sp. NBRC 110057]|uniref:Bcr/CflA family efflux MFS transporter n=1 Tax=Demequina sp. NBRC 110057 TaxID=1570346 RepID=UPI001356405F|nr:Bcr/CflA family efflux MFS transporter [Demequina sp. NBRC 110057]